MSKPPFCFETVRRLEPAQYVDPLHDAAPPGTLFLTGPWGETGGLLKLTARGTFLLLSADEAYGRASIPWPESRDRIRLDGDRVVFELVPAARAQGG